MTASALLSLFNDGKKLCETLKASWAADLVRRAIEETAADVQSRSRSVVLPVKSALTVLNGVVH